MKTRTFPSKEDRLFFLSGRPLSALLVPALVLPVFLLMGCGSDDAQETGEADDFSAPVLVESRDEARADADQVDVEETEAEATGTGAVQEATGEARVVEEWREERVDEDEGISVDAEESADEGQLLSETGFIAVTGTGAAPTAILRREGGGSLGLVGAPARELLRLSGARVRVEGHQAETPTGPGLTVERYEILEIGDRVPEVGVLRALDGAAWELEREGEEPLILEALPTRGMQEGMKIWVVGHEVNPGTLMVESHGVIAPAR